MSTPDASVADELAAMRKLAAAIEPLDPATRERVLGWLALRYEERTASIEINRPDDRYQHETEGGTPA